MYNFLIVLITLALFWAYSSKLQPLHSVPKIIWLAAEKTEPITVRAGAITIYVWWLLYQMYALKSQTYNVASAQAVTGCVFTMRFILFLGHTFMFCWIMYCSTVHWTKLESPSIKYPHTAVNITIIQLYNLHTVYHKNKYHFYLLMVC